MVTGEEPEDEALTNAPPPQHKDQDNQAGVPESNSEQVSTLPWLG
jgi:hypothetical protein